MPEQKQIELSIRILQNELHSWMKIQYDADKDMCRTPNEFTNNILKEAHRYIEDISMAIHLLNLTIQK